MSAFRFSAHQGHQLDAIAAVADLFEGQPARAGAVTEIGAIPNTLVLDDATILHNLRAIQARNGLDVASELAGYARDFDVEMETGTGKTYVYLRTVFELAKRYRFTKFIILVPSVAIREGVVSSITAMGNHFRDLYAEPFDALVYSGNTPEDVEMCATSASVQILVVTIDSIRGDANTRIMHQARDRLNGLRPIDYLAATRPILILDEPQNMESVLSRTAIGELNPLCTLRYSATHRRQRNVVYRLDPMQAHELGLVKQIRVAGVQPVGTQPGPSVKLLAVRRDPGFAARVELSARSTMDGPLSARSFWVRPGQDLSVIAKNAAYEHNWRVDAVSYEPASISFTNGVCLDLGAAAGSRDELVHREMIRETIREHLRKELLLKGTGVKVLSLFFVPTVASYLGDGTTNDTANGEYARWFDEVFDQERDRMAPKLPLQAPHELRRAYFSSIRRRGGQVDFVDTSGVTARDDDAYDLIMRDKARLLDPAEPVRFIFSHSALREGWDNPNVFQICTLRDLKGADERRQTIGRGLRLPVACTPTGFERVADPGVAQLTVIAGESYQEFAQNLQQDYARAGVSIGRADVEHLMRGRPNDTKPQLSDRRPRVHIIRGSREEFIAACVRRIKQEPPIAPARLQLTQTAVSFGADGAKAVATKMRSVAVDDVHSLPDIVSELRSATSLTRATVVDIVVRSGRIGEFIGQPDGVIQLLKRSILDVIHG